MRDCLLHLQKQLVAALVLGVDVELALLLFIHAAPVLHERATGNDHPVAPGTEAVAFPAPANVFAGFGFRPHDHDSALRQCVPMA